MTHICVGELTIIGSDNGLSPERRQAIIWTNAELLLNGPLGTNFSKFLIKILTFVFNKMHLKMSSGKWRPSCLGLNVLMAPIQVYIQIRIFFKSSQTLFIVHFPVSTYLLHCRSWGLNLSLWTSIFASLRGKFKPFWILQKSVFLWWEKKHVCKLASCSRYITCLAFPGIALK